MAHQVKGYSAPIANENIAAVYCEVFLTLAETETFMSPIGGLAPSFPSDSGELIELVSTEADIGDIIVVGLGVDFKYQTERVTLDGTTPVFTTKQFTRVNGLAWAEKPAFIGMIYAQVIGGANTYRSCSPEAQLSLDGSYSIAADRKTQFEQIYAAIVRDANQQSIGSAMLYYRPVGFAFRRPFKFAAATRGDSSATYLNSLPQELKGPIDFYLSAVVSGTNTEVVARITAKMDTL